ncbi:hypothetical protein ABH922_003044 [Rhodococcus sp. 27YEA15]|uniref:DUF6197 family protein n=1 Tax=Rhodococcus sp. 27YEA15 TaxID=3156259 RepID=UPI003C79F622
MTDVSTILNTAADILEQDGWTQGKAVDRITGCRCAIGAINEAAGLTLAGPASTESITVWRDAVFAVRRKIGYSSVPAWNDAEGRTAIEVIAALRAAAVTA